MEKSTLYLAITAIIATAAVLIFGEYFIFQYSIAQSQIKNQVAIATPTPALSPTPFLSPNKTMRSFIFNNPAVVGSVDQINNEVNISVPPGTDVTKLKPIIDVAQNATISPASGVAQDFSSPVAYQVTAQNGSAQTYIVRVTIAKSSEKAIFSFKISNVFPKAEGVIDEAKHTIYVVVPDSANIATLQTDIAISKFATINPVSGSINDFTKNTKYTVTAQDGTTQDYTITVVRESDSG